DMLLHPRLRIVLCGDRRNEEGPVRRLEKEKLAGELRHDSARGRIFSRSGRTQDVEERIFRTVDVFPDPSRAVVQPDPVVAPLAPRPLRKADGRTWRMRREKVRGGDHVDLSLEFSQDRLQPLRALEPPVAKELRVERRDDDAGSAGCLPMLPKGLA